tara:strand:- start:388 stop:624 length:237 start_codon:yes stop_codon:yes gene_type:complete
MVSTEMQEKFDTLTEKDFIEIATSAVDSVMNGKVSKKILVNLSSPDCMIFDPIIVYEHKHLRVEFPNGQEILIMIGLD